MRSSQVTIGDSILASQYNKLRNDAAGSSQLLVHEQSSPGLTLYVEAGIYRIGANRYIYGGGNTPSFTAPTTHPRIDIVTIDSSGTIGITQGTEATSPSAPAYPLNKLVLAEVYNRVSETSLHDTDLGGSNGYVYIDVRPFLGGAYISSDSQVDSGAAISFSKLNSGAINANLLPDADGTRDLGSGSFEWNNIYAKSGVFVNGVGAAISKFGGTGADGALSVSSGTTSVSLGSASEVIKNYSSISITGTGVVNFTSPHANGTLLILKSTGNVTLTSLATPMLDCSGIGGAAGTTMVTLSDSDAFAGNGGNNGGSAFNNGQVWGGGSGGSAGPQVTTYPKFYTKASTDLTYRKVPVIICGAGGGNGGGGTNNNNVGGAGGRGGGAVIIECGGAFNFTTSNGISVAGQDGGTGGTGNNDGGGGGGGGGSGGMLLVFYNTLTANSGTVITTGGNGGNGGVGHQGSGSDSGSSLGTSSPAGGGGGAGAGNLRSAGANGGAGGNSAAGTGPNSGGGSGASGSSGSNVSGGGSGGSGAAGGAGQGAGGPSVYVANGCGGGGGGGGGATGYSIFLPNIYFS